MGNLSRGGDGRQEVGMPFDEEPNRDIPGRTLRFGPETENKEIANPAVGVVKGLGPVTFKLSTVARRLTRSICRIGDADVNLLLNLVVFETDVSQGFVIGVVA